MPKTWLFVLLVIGAHSQMNGKWKSLTTKRNSNNREKKPLLQDGLFTKSEFLIEPDFTDEFYGNFDHAKWYDINPNWHGRQPGLFVSSNVRQNRGELRLIGRYEDNTRVFSGVPEGYENFTTAFVMTRKRARYGYFEVRVRVGNSRLSSSFWMSLDTPEKWTEIDVFEIGGGAVYNGRDYRRTVHMNAHVFRDVEEGIAPNVNSLSFPAAFHTRELLRSEFVTFGLDWNKRYITWVVDGKRVRRIRNSLWDQPLHVKLDVETMPYWFGLPSRKTLPSFYRIKYVRAWSRRRKEKDDLDATKMMGSLLRFIKNPLLNQSNDGFDRIIQGGNVFESMAGSDDNEDGDESVLEVFDGHVQQTPVRKDGLQRGREPGSPERLYMPVRPPWGGASWNKEIRRVNTMFDDVRGTFRDG